VYVGNCKSVHVSCENRPVIALYTDLSCFVSFDNKHNSRMEYHANELAAAFYSVQVAPGVIVLLSVSTDRALTITVPYTSMTPELSERSSKK